jgi:hypothetical protein
MVAPSGVSGVQVVPKAGQALGFRSPRRTCPLKQASGSAARTSSTSKTLSAS